MTSLAAGMVLISGLFFMLGADFRCVQLIVYVGAVMALYAFGMMFFDATGVIKENTTPVWGLLGVNWPNFGIIFQAYYRGNIHSFSRVEGVPIPPSVRERVLPFPNFYGPWGCRGKGLLGSQGKRGKPYGGNKCVKTLQE